MRSGKERKRRRFSMGWFGPVNFHNLAKRLYEQDYSGKNKRRKKLRYGKSGGKEVETLASRAESL